MLRRYAHLRTYTRLRPRRLKPRRGRIEDPAYLRWIRSLACMIQDRDCRGSSDPHHVGHYGQARSNDYNAVPLCRVHHEVAERINDGPFEERFGVSFSAAIQGLNEEYQRRKVV
jgi:hypothetical protein